MIRSFLKYVCLFAAVLGVCAGLLLGVCALIPQSAIAPQMEKAEAWFSAHEGFPLVIEDQPNTRADHYADCALFDVIWNVDSTRPLHSVIAAPYYRIQGNDIRLDFHASVVDGLPPNNEYSRYWHGSQVLLRPLLTFTSIEGCRLVLFGLLLALNAWLAARLMRMRRVRVLAIYAAGLLLVGFWMAAFCIEYITTFLVMTAACIAAVGLWRGAQPMERRVRRMTPLCVISGTVTCFVDFLTTETLTLTVPVLLWLMLCKESDAQPLRFKQALLWLVRFGAAWLCAYAVTFALKWALVYWFLGKEALLNVFSSAAYRIDRSVVEGDAASALTVRSAVLPMMLARNIGMLFPFAESLTTGTALGLAAGVLALMGAALYLFRGRRADGAFIAVLLLVGLLPYARYVALASHAMDHYFFTYRAQMASLIALMAVLAYSLKPSEVLGKKRRKTRR